MIQKEMVKQYMQDFGNISTWQAFSDLGITRLAARISDLKADGISIGQKMETAKNRYGKNVSYMVYWIEGSEK